MFISLATEPANEEAHRRVEIIKELLGLFEQKKIEIVVSTMAIVEFRPYQEQSPHDPGLATFVDNLFNSTDILLYGLTPAIAAMARDIGEKNPSLTPADTVHIATAIVAKADVLFIFDGAGKRRKPKHMIANSERFGTPPLMIAEPFVDFGPLMKKQPADQHPEETPEG